MVRLYLTEMVPEFYSRMLLVSGLPAILRVGTEIDIILRDLFNHEYVGQIDIRYLDAILAHPVVRVGSGYLVYSHVMLTLTVIEDAAFNIYTLAYFAEEAGWRPMIAEGEFVSVPRAPDPD